MNNTLEIGKTIGGGRYIVEKVIGIGGFGITYDVRHVELNAHYAIKEFFISGKCVRENDQSTVCLQGVDPSKYERYRKRFADEARTLVVLNNPHVVRVIDIFEENNTSYIVMEFVPGITLQQKIDNEGKMSYADAVNCMGQLAEAVAYIHEKHILHRDIKPDNVIITPDNRVVLIDFGSAREFVHDEVQNQTAIVTHGYAPLEQYSLTSKKGNYTDIYALGGVFYFLLTGVKPIDATSRMEMRLAEPRELNPEIPPVISRTIMKAMEIRSEDRYQSVDAFMVDLIGKQVVNTESDVPKTIATNNNVLIRSGEEQRKKQWIWIPAFIALLLVVVVAFNVIERRKSGIEIEKITDTYNEKVRVCSMFLNQIVEDEDGIQGNKHIVIQTLKTLQELEEMEQDPRFTRTGLNPVFQQKFSEFRNHLREARASVAENYELQVQFGLEENSYSRELLDRMSLIDYILDQSARGSAVAIRLELFMGS